MSTPSPTPTDALQNKCATPTPSRKNDGTGESSRTSVDDGSQDEGWDPPEMYDEYTASWEEDYARSVGISRTREL